MRATSRQVSGAASANPGKKMPWEKEKCGFGWFFFPPHLSFSVVRQDVPLLLCGGWKAQVAKLAAREARCVARGAGQFALAAQETWDTTLSAGAWVGGASLSALLLQIRRKLSLSLSCFFLIFLFRLSHDLGA